MNETVKNIDIDFQVLENRDPRYLVIYDISEWAHIEDKPAIIEITPPRFSETKTQYIDKRVINMFTSVSLGLSDVREEKRYLPDGVYKITIKGSPDKFFETRYHLKTDNLRLELDKILMKVNFSCSVNRVDTELVKRIKRVELYIKGAEANVRHDNICEATTLLQNAQRDVDRLKTCKTCV